MSRNEYRYTLGQFKQALHKVAPDKVSDLLREAVDGFAEVRDPGEDDAPILSVQVRGALLHWLTELGLRRELDAVGVKPRHTALLSGPPGCGKTTFAYHFASRLGLPLIVADMAGLRSKYVGESGERIKYFFDIVRASEGRCVVLLDEFDALATKRSDDTQGASREANAIVIALLQQVDTFKGYLLAATNQRDSIDSALWRRFAMQIEIDLPDDEQRFAIVSRYMAPVEMSEDDREVISAALAQATPALIKQVLEGVKRDLVLSPRFKLPSDASSCFGRVMVSSQPHADLPQPPLWADPIVTLRALGEMTWPPALPAPKREAA